MSTETVVAKVGQPGGGRFVIVAGSGMGGFLDPPGSLSHNYHVEEYRGSRSSDAEGAMSLNSALRDSWVPAGIKHEIRRLQATEHKQITEDWLESVYRHFQRCYSPDGETRNVSECLIVEPDSEDLPPINWHLAVMFVRSHFPDHEPREDLLDLR